MKHFFLIAFLVVATRVFAAYSDEVLYKAYLASDLSVWNEYIHHTDWAKLSKTEQMRLINYEYGYVAVAIDKKESDAEQHLMDFENHINAVSNLPEALKCTYLSSVAAYKINFHKGKLLQYGLQAFRLSNQAVQADSLNPIALTLKANVLFYAPKAVGGDKQLAMKYFKKSEQIYRQTHHTANNWNYRALQLCIAQCLEQLGKKDEAIDKCREILVEEPNFAYIRDTYLPHLLEK